MTLYSNGDTAFRLTGGKRVRISINSRHGGLPSSKRREQTIFQKKGGRYGMGLDRKYLIWALGYVAVGMGLGIFMAASHNHGQLVTHAHINLVGFLLSFCYGIIHKLWLGQPNPAVAKIQFILHHAASVTLLVGLFLLYGTFVPQAQIEPVLSVGSICVLASALLMLFMVLKSPATAK